MSYWTKTVLALSMLILLLLTTARQYAARQYYASAPVRTQAEFETLMKDVAPLLKRRKTTLRSDIATSISALLDTPQVNEPSAKLSERLAAKKEINSASESSAPVSEANNFATYKSTLKNLQFRFESINQAHLTPCQSDNLYRNWAALHHWIAWAEKRDTYSSSPAGAISAYEDDYLEYTGRPINFEEIKIIGEAEYAAVQTELSALEAKVQLRFGKDLNSFAKITDNFSTSQVDILSRLEPLLNQIESTFEDLGDFNFTSVPKGSIQTKQGYGPRFAIASYIKNDNAMRVYWANGRYNHIHDTMLIIHEIMPGHHLQMSMQTRRVCGKGPVSWSTSMLEGWATYAEFLADERGLFDAPDQRLGWLDYRLVRAMRIIMDTQRIEHSITEDQAWELWQKKMPKRLDDDFPREWARINNSSHHLAYIFGSQAILKAREVISKKMKTGFDEAEFHFALLNAPHKNTMFLPERIEALMRARKRLDTPLSTSEETTL